MNAYKTPILSLIFNVLGVLVLVGALGWLVLGIVTAGESRSVATLLPTIGVSLAAVLSALIYFGVAQAIDYLGRTAHSTNRLCDLLETSIVRHMQSIETRLNSSTPIRVRMDQGKEDKARFYYNSDGTQEGPFTAAEMRHFRESGIVTLATQMRLDGDSQWRTFMDFPDLVRP